MESSAIPGYEFEPAEQVVLAAVRVEMGDALEDPETRAAYEEGRAMESTDARHLIG
jgi:hypothetical protein